MSPKTVLLFKRLGTALLSTVIFVASGEIGLRVYLGAPKGLFLFSRPGSNGMYVPNSSFVAGFGVVPYTVTTNSLGLRCEEVPAKKNRLRIAMLGDSVTDGLFANNSETYPALLEKDLHERGHNTEVINGARGAGSIDKEFAILREVIGPLSPDLVVLTFVTNDIRDIYDESRDQMLSLSMKPTLSESLTSFFYTRTAIGEVSLDVYLRDRFETYRAYEKHQGEPGKDEYHIEGGDHFAENAKLFEKRWGNWDGVVLKEPFSSKTNQAIEDYFFMLDRFREYCATRHAGFVFVYFPSYSQVYDETTSMKIRDVLNARCQDKGIPFLDLTPAFREVGRNEVLHLAPLDFHPNPEGNRVMATALADFLVQQGLLESQRQ